jgi:hypothetical protein
MSVKYSLQMGYVQNIQNKWVRSILSLAVFFVFNDLGRLMGPKYSLQMGYGKNPRYQ